MTKKTIKNNHFKQTAFEKTIHELKDKVLEKADKISKRNNIQLIVFNERSVQEDILREAKVLKSPQKQLKFSRQKLQRGWKMGE